MAKRLKGVTETRQQNWYEEHRKSYEDENSIYEPLWRTDDIPSFGVKTKIPHFKTRHRIVHLLSQNELWMYLHLVRNPLVLDIYEQFAIPIEYSLLIAESLGVQHPVYPDTRVPIIQTIDFVADMINPDTGEVYQAAFPVKQPEDAMRYRTGEKLALQEGYCEIKNIEYELVTSEDLRTTQSINLECLYRYRNLSPLLKRVKDRWLNNFAGHLLDKPHDRTALVIQRSSASTGLDYLTGVSVFYNALWHKTLNMNWNKPLKLEMSASDLGVCVNA